MSANSEVIARRTPSSQVDHEGAEGAEHVERTLPAVDVIEDSHGVTLYADLPGVPRDKLDIRVADGSLSIEAEAVIPVPSGLRLRHGEIRHPRFSRVFTLSQDLDTSRIDAQLRDGVLTLSIPRREEAQPRRIEIRTA
ncbi:Hsp20/alpha crystallin family protein [Burkholderia plantarii]|uniref:Hsp20/alpha crystallin family protein n=1 Tax=Burkholderia plantarii TaxID=41899 RepID=UPI0018DE5931|nr:Hsp20/alpha crystallin family protein [Burkholderia plantarii]MBI0331426.1 Hsp20/alpha crystallin family protein [Burkholderia plantarii]